MSATAAAPVQPGDFAPTTPVEDAAMFAVGELSLETPLDVGLGPERRARPAALVIFGASGDLTHRKLVPALYNLAAQRMLPDEFAVVAVARRPFDTESFRNELRSAVEAFSRTPLQPAIWDAVAESIQYLRGDFHDPDTYRRLANVLDALDRERGLGGSRIYYLATPPEHYTTIIRMIGETGMQHAPGELATVATAAPRIVVEKPFGRDQASARALNACLLEVFREEQIYRIDHYLGKETVQNLLAFRFANGIFEPLWNRVYVDHVQITVAETIGIEGRGAYYEQAGVIRDMMQNHLLQLLTLVAMEPPVALDANAVRDEKVKVLRAIRPIPQNRVDEWTVRGQYSAGTSGGERVPGYRNEPRVAPSSTTETYLAMKLLIDNWRWSGVPFFLRSGKRLPKRVTEIAIAFRPAPHRLFDQRAGRQPPNLLTLNIQPDEGISLVFGAKVPGPAGRLRPVKMDFHYGAAFGTATPEAYERLLLDCLLGDPTLFIRGDETELAWGVVDRVIEGWQRSQVAELPQYEAGTWGPQEADAFIERDGRRWRRL